ncbi:histidine kinase [Thermopolyspora sp. NPDC052614]|uniref:sensor histidine kinase n=1 Tax=Thermopolyspora sp. NPDC052614 TaxID=3155682 RepID=UPI0034477AD4
MDTTRQVRILSCGFVGFLGFPAAELAGLGLTWPVTVAAAAGLVVFGALFIRVIWHNLDRPHTAATPYALAALAATAVALQFALRETWLITASFYLVTLVALVLPRRGWAPALAGFWIGHVALAVLVLQQPFGAAALRGGGIMLYGAAVGATYWLIQVAHELRAARAELARAAISAERLRIARDLHDVLGQRLTEVVLKSEVSARLVAASPERAAAEMRQVSRSARAILAEVRATVSGYREVTLDSELATAREIATAAGVELTVRLPPDPPPPAVATAAAWVVREGVTNVLRHSLARVCRVTVAEGGAEEGVGERDEETHAAADGHVPTAAGRVHTAAGRVYTVTVADDGPARGTRPSTGSIPASDPGSLTGPITGTGSGPDPEAREAPGTGLTGLSERLSALGGDLSVEVDKEWFMLRARIPEGVA